MSMHKSVSLRQAAGLLGISYDMARKLADSGALVTVHIGSRYKVHLSEIERFRQHGNFNPNVNYDTLPAKHIPKDIPSREPDNTLPKDESLYHPTNKAGHSTNTPKADLDPVEKADKHLDYPAWIKRIPK
jgi:excisionase family DNA binding protein